MTLSIELVSDFNIDILGQALTTSMSSLELEVVNTPYSQVFQTLTREVVNPDQVGVVWTRPEAVVASYQHALRFDQEKVNNIVAEVDAFADAIQNYAARRMYVLVIQWTATDNNPGHGMLDWKPGFGLRALLAKMQIRLAERLSETNNVFVVDAERWISGHRTESASKMWFAAKVPFETESFNKAALGIRDILLGLTGKSRRLIVLDLDDTLWGGVVGEQGWEGVRLGGHDFRGEAFVAFQKELKALSLRGIQLAVVSKNTESVALQAFEKNPEMVLRVSDLAGNHVPQV